MEKIAASTTQHWTKVKVEPAGRGDRVRVNAGTCTQDTWVSGLTATTHWLIRFWSWFGWILSDGCQELSQVGYQNRNPASQRLIDYVSRAYNTGLVLRLNLGVCSLMWVDDYDEGLGLYAAQCEYLKPSWSDMTWGTEWEEDASPTNRRSAPNIWSALSSNI